MAEQQPGTDFQPGPDQVSMTRVAQWGGALISVALVIGAGVWAYNIVVRDVSGIPIVRAADGPLRIQPDDPGGRQADNQGLAVNNVVSEGEASASADTLILAPDPVALDGEDAPFGTLQLQSNPELAPTPSLAEAETPEEQRDAVLGLADQLIAEQEQEAARVGDDAILMAVLEAAATADASGAPTSSPFPQLRPATGAPLPTQAAPGPSSVTELAASAVPDGSRLVQLGAFGSESVARSEWSRMAGLFPGYLDDKTRVIQRAESGGRVFYRLRAMGFEDIDDARRFCAAFKSRNVDCVPVLVR